MIVKCLISNGQTKLQGRFKQDTDDHNSICHVFVYIHVHMHILGIPHFMLQNQIDFVIKRV